MKITEKEYNATIAKIAEKYRALDHEVFLAYKGKQLDEPAFKQLSEYDRARENEIETAYREFIKGVEIGDGVTCHLYSDAEAYTVIGRTEKRLYIQRDKAIRHKDFKPEWVAGGFSGICVNQDDQKWTYEPNPNGAVVTVAWSNKYNRWMWGGKSVTMGRDEYYDYNF